LWHKKKHANKEQVIMVYVHAVVWVQYLPEWADGIMSQLCQGAS
jgi:hypothetical protein